MAKQRILYVSQEIAPYLPATQNSKLGRDLPQAIQERKFEVRIFMPNFGAVNERRNQLHEVIRLSGVNIPIDDVDHPLIIKVASMQPSRIQVYFIDNDDYFQKSDDDVDPIGSNRADNDERSIFFAHGTIETARKLQWEPDFVHASGWISALIPLYIRSVFSNEESFKNSKIIYSVVDGVQPATIDPNMINKLKDQGDITEVDINSLSAIPFDENILHRIAIQYADAVVFNTNEPNQELLDAVNAKGIPFITLDPEANNMDAYNEFYQSLSTQP